MTIVVLEHDFLLPLFGTTFHRTLSIGVKTRMPYRQKKSIIRHQKQAREILIKYFPVFPS